MSFYDDIVIGEPIELGEHLFTAEEIVRFARAFDPQPFHLDAEAATASLFGGLCASGWHTTAVFMKLNVRSMAAIAARRAAEGLDLPAWGPSPGVRNIKWLRPIFAGDRIAYRTTATAKRLSKSRPGWAVVDSHVDASTEDGKPVLSFDASVFLRVLPDQAIS